MAETKQTALTLEQQLVAKRADLLTAQNSLYGGTLQNPHAIKAIRKDIARLLNKINQEKGAQ
ncbi:MAG: 50S ribosomal protein L29 [Candidatus Saccharibacteria bacterium]|nr:50S ribosomal protein L29 [Candidatus Saccharibacteria bacterium]